MTKQEKIREVIKEGICSKCGYPIKGIGSLQAKITNGELVHIQCPKVVTKQEEIREGIADILGRNWGDSWDVHNAVAGDLVRYLHSQGVVLKVEMELPDIEKLDYGDPYHYNPFVTGFRDGQKHYKNKVKAGYVATESLIKDKQCQQVKG